MRQVGILCAAALVALHENVEKLESDHKNARFLAGMFFTMLTYQVKTQKRTKHNSDRNNSLFVGVCCSRTLTHVGHRTPFNITQMLIGSQAILASLFEEVQFKHTL